MLTQVGNRNTRRQKAQRAKDIAAEHQGRPQDHQSATERIGPQKERRSGSMALSRIREKILDHLLYISHVS
jgi:hypothetical protein